MTRTQKLQPRGEISATEREAAPAAGGRDVQFVAALAQALIRAGEPEGLVQPRVARIATVYRLLDLRLVVLPNVTLAAAERGAPVALDSRAPSETELRVEQIAAVAQVARLADRGAVQPDAGLRALDEAQALKHRFGPAGIVAGHVLITMGACLILQPTPIVLLTSALLGTLVAVLKLWARRASTLRVLLPLVAATLVSLLAFAIAPASRGSNRCAS